MGTGAGSVPLDGLASLDFNTASNRITSPGYEYDPAGNLTRGQTDNGVWLRYKYDAAGRLAQVLNDNNVPQETYSYGASNKRLKTVYGDGLGAPARYYGWDGDQVITEYRDGVSNNLEWEKHYIYLGGRLLATTDSGGTKYHHPDRLGTRLITDGATGAVLTEQVNLPFGTALSGESSGEISNRRFTSYDRRGMTGMDYAVNRFYSAAQGRFTQVDPIGMRAVSLSDPQSLNLYSYVQNDPVNFIDPTGRDIIAVTSCVTIKLDGEIIGIDCETVYYITSLGPVSLPFGGIGDGGGPAAGAQQSQQVNQTDCQRFVDMTRQIAEQATNTEDFFNRMARTFTAANDSTIGEMRRAANLALPADRPRFGATGFKREFRDTSNQVRHATGGLIAGYRLGYILGRIVMNWRETSPADDPDILLNSETTWLGHLHGTQPGTKAYESSGGYRGLAYAIRRRLCDP